MGEEYFIETEKMKDLQEKLEEPSKTHFVLIHGISGGGWCWYKIKSLMEISGYKVTCLDLKGAGIHPADPTTLLSFDEYNDPLINFLSSLPENEQVILVGHSAGGLSVTDATHRFPKKVRLAVYIGATMLRTGFVTEQDVKDGITFGEYGNMVVLILVSMMIDDVHAGDTNPVFDPCSDTKVQRWDGFTFGLVFYSKESFFFNDSQLFPCDRRLFLSGNSAELALFRPKVDDISLLTINSSNFSSVGKRSRDQEKIICIGL